MSQWNKMVVNDILEPFVHVVIDNGNELVPEFAFVFEIFDHWGAFLKSGFGGSVKSGIG
jgi:hypothetical protein